MRNLTQALTLTSMATAVRGAFNIASVNPVLWWGAESHRAALAGVAGATSTLFQDSVGTSAVSAIEQPVGRVIDQSGRGNHAAQSTSAARPTLSSRVNLLSSTNMLGWEYQSSVQVTPAPNVPDSVGGAETLRVHHVSTGYSFVRTTLYGVGAPLYASIRIKKGNYRFVGFRVFTYSASVELCIVIDLDSAQIGYVPTGFVSNVSLIDCGAGWFEVRCRVEDPQSSPYFSICVTNEVGSEYLTGTDAFFYVHQPQTSRVPWATYQRITTATDYDWQVAPVALGFDGLDDSVSTNFAAGTLGGSMDAWVVCSLAEGETTAVLVDDPTSAGVRYFATLDAGVSGSTQRQDGAATANASFSVNGQLAGNVANPSRGALYSAVAGAGISIVQATNLNLSAWQGVKIGTYASSGGGYGFRGRHFALLICPAQPDAIRTKIRKALAKQFGIQGVV
jgi:hypothetical protein